MGGGTEAFPDLGAHCSHADCHQLDFLPFLCDSCKHTFCLEHRSYKAHNCAKEGMKDTTVVICPICAGTVKSVFGEPVDLTIGRHMQEGSCDPTNYDKVMKKPKCPVKRCKEVLTSTNTYTCKTCKTKVCMKHRFPADHVCRPLPKSRASAMEALQQRFVNIIGKRSGTECAASSSKVGPKLGTTSSRSLSVH